MVIMVMVIHVMSIRRMILLRFFALKLPVYVGKPAQESGLHALSREMPGSPL
jgi:hypothetical protein